VVVPKAGLSKIPNAFTGIIGLYRLFFDCKQQRLMYILQNQNDCPIRPSQLNCNLYRRNKETQHTPLNFS
jgi:hypothetical protein